MDCIGPTGCWQHIEEISTGLVTEGRKRGWLLVCLPGAAFVAKLLVWFAIWLSARRFKSNKQDTPKRAYPIPHYCEAICLLCSQFDPDSPGCVYVPECERIEHWHNAIQEGHCLIERW